MLSHLEKALHEYAIFYHGHFPFLSLSFSFHFILFSF